MADVKGVYLRRVPTLNVVSSVAELGATNWTKKRNGSMAASIGVHSFCLFIVCAPFRSLR